MGEKLLNERVIRYDLANRTRYVPSSLTESAKVVPTITSRLLRRPISTLRRARAIRRDDRSVRKHVGHVARALSVSEETPDLCLIHGLGSALFFPWLRSIYPGVPIAMYYHGGEVPTVERWESTAVADAFDNVDIVFTNTPSSKQTAVARGCPSDKIVILPVGFVLKDFQPNRDRVYRQDGTLRLLSAGRMSEEKGFIYVLRALKQLVERGYKDITYSLTGQGYLRPELEAYVSENNLRPYVQFLGTLSTEGVLDAMATCDALILPSIRVNDWVENQACAVQEAMLMKALVITSQTGGVPDSIPDVMQPFSVPPGDASSLAEAIAKVHALAPDELRRLGELNRQFVMDGYDIRELNKRMIELAGGLLPIKYSN